MQYILRSFRLAYRDVPLYFYPANDACSPTGRANPISNLLRQTLFARRLVTLQSSALCATIISPLLTTVTFWMACAHHRLTARRCKFY